MTALPPPLGHLCLLLLALLPACSNHSSHIPLEGRTIATLEIRQHGNTKLDEARLRTFIQSKEGTTYSPETINSDIKTLFESGLANDIAMDAQPSGEKVKVIANIETREPSGPSGFVGNTVFSNQQLARVTGLQCRPINPATLKIACDKVADHYHRHGYPEVRIETRSLGGLPTFMVHEGLYKPR